MTIKVIRKGPPLKKKKKFKLSCSECRSQLEAVESDGTWTPDRGRDYLVFICPVCRCSIWVDP